METKSGMDLSWLWNDWFYSNKYLDKAIESITRFAQSATPSYTRRMDY
jgi:hypothetical protein